MEALSTLYIIALCYRATKANAVELAECFDDVSQDALTRLLVITCCWQKRLWHEVTKRLPLRGGWLEIDDTVLDKFGAAIWGVYWVYSSRQQRVVRGMNVVVLIWTDGRRRLPVGIKIWRRGGPSKVVLAAKLLRWAHHLGLQPDYVLMDSWYSAKRLLKQIRAYDWHFVTRLKKNRSWAGKQLRHHWRRRFGHGLGKLSGGIEVLVVKDGHRFLTTSALTLTVPQVKALYVKRQHIEEFFKVMRGQLRWHQCPARSQAAQVAHLHLCLLAFLVLQEEGVRQNTTVYQIRRKLFREAVPKQTHLLEGFTFLA
jgi:putative transposase